MNWLYGPGDVARHVCPRCTIPVHPLHLKNHYVQGVCRYRLGTHTLLANRVHDE